MEMLCDKNKYFECWFVEFVCYGYENDSLFVKFSCWIVCVIVECDLYVLLCMIVDGIVDVFDVL